MSELNAEESWPKGCQARCRCGWWLGKVVLFFDSWGEGIIRVEGDCKRHGHVVAESFEVWP